MDGIIIINKEKQFTSHDVVAKVKKTLQTDKVGHTGTLDPNATGVLPLLLGKGTKLSKYLINHDKKYEVVLKLGEKTSSGDVEGEIIQTQVVNQDCLENEVVEKALRSFVGMQEQIPPMYSAIKVKGKKLYEYARKGQVVEVKPRTIHIYQMKLLEIDLDSTCIIFEVDCSKGTYIRSLCEDIAEKLETVGYMKELKRTKVGQFDIKDAIRIEQLQQNKENKQYLENHIITIEELLKEKASLQLDAKKLPLFLNGVKLTIPKEDNIYRIYNMQDEFIGTGIITGKLLKRDIII